MKQIKKISDLVINETYYLCFVKEAKLSKKIRLLGIVNETVEYDDCHKTELFFETKESIHLAYFKEIGIGRTKQEASNNYGKFKYEKNNKFFDTLKKLEANANFLRTLNSIRKIEQRHE